MTQRPDELVINCLESARLKLDRAEAHLDDPRRDVEGFVQSQSHRIWTESDLDATQHLAYVEFDPTPCIERWGLVFGDVLHNFRSALDHAVFAVAQRESGRDNPPGAEKLMFSIRECREDYSKTLWRLKGIGADALSAIEALQPYHGPQRFDPPGLSWLEDLNNIDKHRFVPLAVLAFDSNPWDIHPGYTVSGLPPVTGYGVASSFVLATGPLQDRAPWLEIQTATAAPDVKVESAPPLLIGLQHVVRADGRTRTSLLDIGTAMSVEVKRVVATLEAAV